VTAAVIYSPRVTPQTTNTHQQHVTKALTAASNLQHASRVSLHRRRDTVYNRLQRGSPSSLLLLLLLRRRRGTRPLQLKFAVPELHALATTRGSDGAHGRCLFLVKRLLPVAGKVLAARVQLEAPMAARTHLSRCF
jgi:hypothetical protein